MSEFFGLGFVEIVVTKHPVELPHHIGTMGIVFVYQGLHFEANALIEALTKALEQLDLLPCLRDFFGEAVELFLLRTEQFFVHAALDYNFGEKVFFHGKN